MTNGNDTPGGDKNEKNREHVMVSGARFQANTNIHSTNQFSLTSPRGLMSSE
eukprot:CAMPEP_0172318578 /NCGR_PEP_ID=MMETSP1058-20130122/35261_1 /TAXON_ID=83371 /ORGANISM="Detonula confervacea, Strain CCMP 353" /LENGTH=51 /DNA_ID=CAMNT_0013033435 /DNA_START=9 /DNA_END=161 /DNA_ORIENTATION=+